MIGSVIEWSVRNPFLVGLLTIALAAAGVWSLQQTPLDAIPDLSDVQVILLADYPGQAPQVVEDQVTYPLTSKMLAVPHARTVRGFSFFGLSFVYVIFDEGTDLYWARSRVLEVAVNTDAGCSCLPTSRGDTVAGARRHRGRLGFPVQC